MFAAEILGLEPECVVIPVIGGNSECTIVPVLSQAKPSNDFKPVRLKIFLKIIIIIIMREKCQQF